MSARDRKPPDWKHWRLLDGVKAWEAAALSMGIDPPSLKFSRNAWMVADCLGRWQYLFSDDSFRSAKERAAFDDRFRLIEDAFVRRYGDRVSYHNTGIVSLAAFAAWCVENEVDVPAEFASLGGASPAAAETETVRNAASDPDEELAALFDPITTTQLQAMFPDAGEWAKWAERASRNGLSSARSQSEPKMFNPFLAARWWLAKQDPQGWTWERCLRRLAKNLPPRSQDSRSLLTGELD